MVYRRASSNTRVLRILRIYQMLLTEKLCNARVLASEFQVDARTIKRDIDLLRDIPLLVMYDTKKRSYYLGGRQNHRNGNGLFGSCETMILLKGLWALQKFCSGYDENMVERLRARLLSHLNDEERTVLQWRCSRLGRAS